MATIANDSDDEIKQKPKSIWEKIFTSTPVIMTVVATILAGLSSGESSQSQYFRAMAAQNQSKAGDQWAYFQAKKTRSAMASQERLNLLGQAKPLTDASIASLQEMLPAQLGGGSATKNSTLFSQVHEPAFKEAILSLNKPLPKADVLKFSDPEFQEIFTAISRGDENSIDDKKIVQLKDEVIEAAMATARKMVADSDDQIAATTKSAKGYQEALELIGMKTEAAKTGDSAVSPFRQIVMDFTYAKLNFESARLEREARLNQNVATIYEVIVNKSSWQSQRARTRSKFFFYGMLAAQAAVTIATMALAVRDKNWLWGIAAAIGFVAIGYGAYIYVYT